MVRTMQRIGAPSNVPTRAWLGMICGGGSLRTYSEFESMLYHKNNPERTRGP
jgi:hypothetical protein